jgi:hypothetical protein
MTERTVRALLADRTPSIGFVARRRTARRPTRPSGGLVAREAGARVFDHDGRAHTTESTATIAANAGLCGELLSILRIVLIFGDPGATTTA